MPKTVVLVPLGNNHADKQCQVLENHYSILAWVRLAQYWLSGDATRNTD